MRRSTATILLLLAAAGAQASDLLVMSGVEPLKGQINQNKDSVRLLFFGSPT